MIKYVKLTCRSAEFNEARCKTAAERRFVFDPVIEGCRVNEGKQGGGGRGDGSPRTRGSAAEELIGRVEPNYLLCQTARFLDELVLT